MTKTPETPKITYTPEEWAVMLEADRKQLDALRYASNQLRRAREAAAAATDCAREAARIAYADGAGLTKHEIATRLEISRVTLDKWLR